MPRTHTKANASNRHTFGKFKISRRARVTDWRVYSSLDKDLIEEEVRRFSQPASGCVRDDRTTRCR